MINEDYVSFETARLLKEKGFDVETKHKMWYVIEQFSTGCPWNSCTYKVGDVTREYNDDCCISMPTLQMAMKWLREAHDIFIKLEFDVDEDVQWHPSLALIKGNKYIHTNELQWYDTYEQACEAAILYCLENLIK